MAFIKHIYLFKFEWYYYVRPTHYTVINQKQMNTSWTLVDKTLKTKSANAHFGLKSWKIPAHLN